MTDTVSPILTFRPLKSLDALSLRDLRHRAIRDEPEVFGTSPEVELGKTGAHYRRGLLKTGPTRGEVILGLWRDRTLVGMVGLGLREERLGRHGLIFSMYVVPELRGQGWGTRMLEEGQHRMRSMWQLRRFELCVETRNQGARRLYERAGFSCYRTDRNVFTIHGTSYDVHRMVKR